MYIYLDKQGVVKEIINDEALRQSASNVNEIYVYYDGLQEADIGSVLATYGLPDGTITDEMQVATQTQESEIPYNAERDLKYFQYYKAYPFYHFAIADLALSQEGVVRLMIRLAQKDSEYIKVAGLICFDVEGELVKEDHGISVAQYNYLVKAWYETKECLPLDGSKAMQDNLDMGAHNVIFNGKALKGNNGALNYNGKDLAKREDVSSLQSQIDTINATQNVVDIVGTKAELNAYETKDLHANDKIEVLTDESQNNANTIYEWNGNAWSLVGSKAPYYSKAESDDRYNELKAKSYDKDATLDDLTQGHVPDSNVVKGISVDVKAQKQMLDTIGDETIKNTKNIENLSAVMPTGINVDSNNFVILEHDGKEITGQKKKTNLVFSYETLYGELNKYSIVSILLDRGDNSTFVKGNLKLWYSAFTSSYSDVTLELRSTRSHSTGYKYAQLVVSEDFKQVKFIAGDEEIVKKYNVYFRLASLTTNVSLYMPLKSGTFALIEDLDAKQATLYHHTITLHNATNTAYFTFSIDRTWQAEITKDTLFTVLNGYIAAGTGIVQNMLIDKISFHNTAEKTKVHQYASFGASGYVNAEVTFASVFGTDYTLEDVTYPLA